MILPKFVGGGASQEDMDLQKKVMFRIRSAARGHGPLLADVILNPVEFGVTNVVRVELLKIVANTLEKAGFAGSPVDMGTQKRMISVLKMHEQKMNGGFF